MRVSYRSCRSSRIKVYEQIGPLDFCCREMRAEWGIVIGFGIKGHARTSSREVNIFTLHPQSTGTIIPGITEIRYCPWCSEEIEVCRVKKA